MIQVTAKDVSFGFVPDTGLLDGFTVWDGDREIAPLHRAPWVGTKEVMPADAAPLMARLGGDFFCAPFALAEHESALHGWPPNSEWRVEPAASGELVAVLMRSVFGATLTKRLSVRDGHPFVYQTHSFQGGSGRVTVSNHANVSVKQGGLIRASPKRVWETPTTPQESDPERGRSGLICPAQSEDPSKFPGQDGPVDLTRYPWNPGHEDFVVGIEAMGHDLGWTAVTRPAAGDLFLSLRDPRVLPMTMLWHSNGGRDYPPWSGRHIGCLGVEEGAAEHMLGVSTEADLTGPGALTLNSAGVAQVRHVIGAIAWPSGEAIAEIWIDGDALRITGERGAMRRVPFDKSFLHLAEAGI
jgi:hypothetical protein